MDQSIHWWAFGLKAKRLWFQSASKKGRYVFRIVLLRKRIKEKREGSTASRCHDTIFAPQIPMNKGMGDKQKNNGNRRVCAKPLLNTDKH
ncbi:hypothetical protein DX873_02750 [Flagellimonas nanhaiensis]|uniref:Uncharacterized protein n=1 Tax=Flagellimonas nanhaiensis TaxID=2292706 RepID=A0A371JTI6_9FLAO|nr:hypothetical protein DX873_02750 [Allomuricauda nanhaiensis]